MIIKENKNSINLFDIKSIEIMGDATYGQEHYLTIKVKANDGTLYAIHLQNKESAIKVKS